VIETLSSTPAGPSAADADADGAGPAPGASGRPAWAWTAPPPSAAAAAVVAVALIGAYAPNVRNLVTIWNREPNYSHGFLVLPVALVILWRRWAGDGEGRSQAPPALVPSPWGWAGLVAVLAARAFCYERGLEWTETATLLPAVACLVLALGGWPLLRRIWPAVAFLVFLFPLPVGVNGFLSLPLQRLAATASGMLLRLSGLWVASEGNRLLVGEDQLEVAAVCNGLSMLMTLAATVATMITLVPMDTWKRVVLLLSIIPVALASNVLRIVETAWSYRLFGAAVGGHFAHDAAGWLMMPTALALVGLELALLSWLVIREEEEVVTRPDFVGRRRQRA
jgi:exosortase